MLGYARIEIIDIIDSNAHANPTYAFAAVISTSTLNSGRVKPATTTSVEANASPAK